MPKQDTPPATIRKLVLWLALAGGVAGAVYAAWQALPPRKKTLWTND